jgi:hypothetical protein
MSVEYNGNLYHIDIKDEMYTLDLSGLQIDDITAIEGLEELTELRVLNLNHNFITRIKGLESLENLEELHLDHNRISIIEGLDCPSNLHRLSLYHNQIERINNFDNLDNLNSIHLGKNPIYARILNILGEVTPQTVLEYCQMPVEEKERSWKSVNLNLKDKAKVWGLTALLALVFGFLIFFLSFLWGTIIMVLAVILVVGLIKGALSSDSQTRGDKINLIISALVFFIIMIVLYANFQIFWYFG